MSLMPIGKVVHSPHWHPAIFQKIESRDAKGPGRLFESICRQFSPVLIELERTNLSHKMWDHAEDGESATEKEKNGAASASSRLGLEGLRASRRTTARLAQRQGARRACLSSLCFRSAATAKRDSWVEQSPEELAMEQSEMAKGKARKVLSKASTNPPALQKPLRLGSDFGAEGATPYFTYPAGGADDSPSLLFQNTVNPKNCHPTNDLGRQPGGFVGLRTHCGYTNPWKT